MSESNIGTKQQSNNISLSNSEKLIIRYTIVFLLSFLLGLIGYYMLQIPSSEVLVRYIDAYFSRSFNIDLSFSHNATLIFATSFQDIKTMGYVFIAGFTMFSSVAIYWILISEALSLGFCSLFLVNTMSEGVLSNATFFDLVLFLVTSSAISSIIILYCAKTKLFNESFRSLGNLKLKIVNYKPLYIQIFTFLTLCGAIILVNVLRFVFNLI